MRVRHTYCVCKWLVTYTAEISVCEVKKERERESEEKGDNHAWLIIAVLCCCSGDVSNLGKAERPMRPVIRKAYYFKCYSQENEYIKD